MRTSIVIARAAAASVFAFAAAQASCLTLEDVPQAGCGNGVIEPGEDCDRASDPSCYPPGSPNACRFKCASNADCKVAGYRCAPGTGVCVAPSGQFTAINSVELGAVSEVALADFNGDGFVDVFASGQLESNVLYINFDGSLAARTSIPTHLGDAALGDVS